VAVSVSDTNSEPMLDSTESPRFNNEKLFSHNKDFYSLENKTTD